MESRVKLIRKELKMTQEQLAQRLGIGKAALSMIETGKCGLSTRNKNILVQDLNVNPDWLDTGKGNMFNAEPDLTAFRLRTDNSLPMQSVPYTLLRVRRALYLYLMTTPQTNPSTLSISPTCPSATVRFMFRETRCIRC